MQHFNWAPGIGDPTLGGWLTVVLYFLAAASCWIAVRKIAMPYPIGGKEQHAWRSISALLLALGINKQLDLQTAFTEAGRVLAHAQGWYDQRQAAQQVFICLVAIACLVAVIILLVWAHKTTAPTWLALSGATVLLGFVVIRAASFHHVDHLIGEQFLGVRWNRIIEVGGISVVIWASLWRQIIPEAETQPPSNEGILHPFLRRW